MSTQGRLSIEGKSTVAFDAVERGPIYHLSDYCDRLFKQILEEKHIKFKLEDHKRLLSELQVRFTAWLSYLGVFASAKASLDHRLRRNAAYRDLVLLALDMLRMNLINFLPAHDTLDKSSGSDVCHDDFLNVVISGLQAATGQLDRLAITIRQFSSSTLAARVKAFADKSFKDVVHFETKAMLALEILYPDAPARLRMHLAKSMSDRFAKLLYWKSHNGKLQGDSRSGDTIKPVIARSLATMDRELSKMDIKTEADSTKNASLEQPTPKRLMSFERTETETVATTMISNRLTEVIAPHTPKLEKSATSVAVGKLVYPSPPKIEQGLTHATCTFCYKRYSADNYSQDRWWKNHVKGDLQPYVCLVPNCHDSKTFSVDKAWESHMAEEHGKDWLQFICKVASHESDKIESDEYSDSALSNKDVPKSHLGESHGEHEDSLLPGINTETFYTEWKVICGFCLREIEKEGNVATEGKTWHIPEATVSKDGRHSAATDSRLRKTLAKTVTFVADDTIDEAAASGDNNSSTSLFSREISRHISSHLEYLSLLTLRLSSSMWVEDQDNDFHSCVGESELEGQAERSTLADTFPEAEPNDIMDPGKSYESVSTNHDFHSSSGKSELEGQAERSTLLDTITDAGPDTIMDADPDDTIMDTEPEEPDTFMDADPGDTSNEGKGYESVSIDRVEETWTAFVGRQIRSRLLPEDEPILNQFLPLGDLQIILSPTSIDEILREILGRDDSISDITYKILGSGCKPSLKVFATLIIIEKVEHVTQFLQLGVHDEVLPLTLKSDLKVFQNWSQSDIEAFCERQYTFMAPIFDFTTTQHYQWSRLLRMPFLEPLKWEKGGAHGQVAKVKIHPQHQAWKTPLNSGSQTSWFAVKKFIAHDTEGVAIFNKERAALLKFSKENNGHKHLIKLLLSYQIEDSLYMIFPWADGNLAEFWQKYPSKPSENDAFWLIHQCFGLSDGLSKIHGYSQRLPRYRHAEGITDKDDANRGRHGDIKPENILFFCEPESDRGDLVVSDFTLMRFHSDDTIHKTAANDVGYSKAYCPPEVQHGSNTFIDQKYDIWTLGCVYLEFITWYMHGYDAIRGRYFENSSGDPLHSFQTMRRKDKGGSDDTYFSHVSGRPPKVKVKESVSTWISMLHKHEHCSQAIHDFLSLIDHHMLVPLPDDRYSMNQVRDELQIIASKSRRDSNYCQSGIPTGTIIGGLNHLSERSGTSSFQPVREPTTTTEQELREALRGQAKWKML